MTATDNPWHCYISRVRIAPLRSMELHSSSIGKNMQETGISAPHTRPRPGRRRPLSYLTSSSSTFSVLFLTLIFSLLWAPVHASYQQDGLPRFINDHLVARKADILFDAGPVPLPAIHRRAAASSSLETKTTKASHTSVATSIISEPTGTDAPLPTPFDGGLGTNYTQPSCPNFIHSMISNDTFNACVPFSLLLQNSMSFFSASRTLLSITHVLNASCAVVYPSCSSLISSFALSLRSSSACAQDYERENPIVRQAYAGLISYDIFYQAACLKNTPVPGVPISNDNNYCYANAVTNMTSPSDNYIYFLPLGIALPPASLPTCNGCLKNTMAIFAMGAANKSQPLSLDYVNAASMVNVDCGPNFVNATAFSTASETGGKSTSGAVKRGFGQWEWLVLVLGVGAVQLFINW